MPKPLRHAPGGIVFHCLNRGLLSQWPVARPTDWLELINTPQTTAELEAVRASVKRGRPYGQATWQRQIARLLGLEASFRPQGRPQKPAGVSAVVADHDEVMGQNET